MRICRQTLSITGRDVATCCSTANIGPFHSRQPPQQPREIAPLPGSSSFSCHMLRTTCYMLHATCYMLQSYFRLQSTGVCGGVSVRHVVVMNRGTSCRCPVFEALEEEPSRTCVCGVIKKIIGADNAAHRPVVNIYMYMLEDRSDLFKGAGTTSSCPATIMLRVSQNQPRAGQ